MSRFRDQRSSLRTFPSELLPLAAIPASNC
jgi:hypothetical protein